MDSATTQICLATLLAIALIAIAWLGFRVWQLRSHPSQLIRPSRSKLVIRKLKAHVKRITTTEIKHRLFPKIVLCVIGKAHQCIPLALDLLSSSRRQMIADTLAEANRTASALIWQETMGEVEQAMYEAVQYVCQASIALMNGRKRFADSLLHGQLPPGTFAVRVANDYMVLVMQEEPRLRSLLFAADYVQRRESRTLPLNLQLRYNLAMPHVVYLYLIVEGKPVAMSVHWAKEPLENKDSMLYTVPLPNIFEHAGVCMGDAKPDVENLSLADSTELFKRSFWLSAFNDDLYYLAADAVCDSRLERLLTWERCSAEPLFILDCEMLPFGTLEEAMASIVVHHLDEEHHTEVDDYRAIIEELRNDAIAHLVRDVETIGRKVSSRGYGRAVFNTVEQYLDGAIREVLDRLIDLVCQRGISEVEVDDACLELVKSLQAKLEAELFPPGSAG